MPERHSAYHQKKDPPRTPRLEPLFTRDELAARWHVTAQHITRNAARLGLRAVRVGKRVLFPESQIVEAERRQTIGEVA
jgi:hypothetical protein